MIFFGGGQSRLFPALDPRDLVTQVGRLFKLQLLGRQLHLAGELFYHSLAILGGERLFLGGRGVLHRVDARTLARVAGILLLGADLDDVADVLDDGLGGDARSEDTSELQSPS